MLKLIFVELMHSCSLSLSLSLFSLSLPLPPPLPPLLLSLSLSPTIPWTPSFSFTHDTHTHTHTHIHVSLYLITCHFHILIEVQDSLSLYVCIGPKLSCPLVRSTLCHNRHRHSQLGNLETWGTGAHPYNDNTLQVSCCRDGLH